MERDLVDRPSRTLSKDGHPAIQDVDSRSRSRSPNPPTGSLRRFRERSRSPLRKSPGTAHSHSENYDNGDRHGYRGGRPHVRHRGYRDEDPEMAKERPSHRNPRHRQGRERSLSSSRKRRPSDREAPRPSSRHNSAHDRHHADSSLPPERTALSPTPTPPNASVTRFPLPEENERQSPRHRHRHHSRRRSPSRSGTSRRHRARHTRRRSSTHSLASLNSPRGEGTVSLPYRARALSRWDFAAFEPLFAYYLELQKQLRMADLDEREVRGRWKSFVGRWNRGELAEGWYEPEMFLRVVRARSMGEAGAEAEAGAGAGAGAVRGADDVTGLVMTPPTTGTSMVHSAMEGVATETNGPGGGGVTDREPAQGADDDDDDDDDWGPSLPGSSRLSHSGLGPGDANPARTPATAAARTGPAVPTLQDLEVRRELEAEERQGRIADLRLARRADRHEQKERLEELAPRAEPGSRERQLEKRREAADAMREMRGAAGAGGAGLEEVGDSELMGDAGEGGAEDYRRVLATMQRRKTERELRREEILRAKNEEREERIRGYKEREEETVDMLKELARQRFG